MKPRDLNEIKIICHHSDLSQASIISNNYSLSETQVRLIQESIEKYRDGFPLDYLFGEITFLEQEFTINESVLIPRVETEEWVYKIIQKNKTKNKTLILADIATGSGVIGLSLAPFFKKTYLSDIDSQALQISQKNLENYRLKQINSENIFILQSDLLKEYLKDNIQIDILTANLPYVPESDKQLAIINQVNYEPAIALYSGIDGLDLFRELIKQIIELNQQTKIQDGKEIQEIYLELDPRNIRLAKQITEEKLINYSWGIWLDENNLERVLVGSRTQPIS